MFLPFLWSLIGFALLWIFVDIWWVKLAFLLIQYPLMVAWWELIKLSKKLAGKWRFLLCSKKRTDLKNQRDELLKFFFEN